MACSNIKNAHSMASGYVVAPCSVCCSSQAHLVCIKSLSDIDPCKEVDGELDHLVKKPQGDLRFAERFVQRSKILDFSIFMIK